MTTIATDQLVLHLAHAALRRGSFMAAPPMDLHATDFTIAANVALSSLGARNVILGNWPANGAQMLFAVDGAGAPTIDLCKYTRATTQRVDGAPIGGIVFGDPGMSVKVDSMAWPVGSPVTVEFWTCTGDVGGSTAFSLGSKENPDRYLSHVPWSDGMLYWDYGHTQYNGRAGLDFRPYTKKWTHVALVSEGAGGSGMRIYLNGEPMVSPAKSSAPATALTGLMIGGWGGSRHLGEIAEFRIWSRVRTQAEIRELKNKVPPADAEGLAGYWPLDEGQGVVAHDRSIHGRNGVVTAGAKWVTEQVRRSDPERPRFQATGDKPWVSLVSDQKLKAQTWHHAAVTFTWGADRKSPTCTLYVDGSPAGQVSPGVAPGSDLVHPYVLRPSGAPYLLGQKQDAVDDQSACNGQIRDLRVFTTALAPEMIAMLAFEDRKRIPDVGPWSFSRTDDLTQILGLDYALMGALHRRSVLTFEDLGSVPLVDLKRMFTEERCYVPRDELLVTWPQQARLLVEDPQAAAALHKTLFGQFDFVLTNILGLDNAIQGALVALGKPAYLDMQTDPSALHEELVRRGLPMPRQLLETWPIQADMLRNGVLVELERVRKELYEMAGIPAGMPLSFLMGIDHRIQAVLYELGVRTHDDLSKVYPSYLCAQLKPLWPSQTKHPITRELAAEWRAEAAAALRNDLTGLRILKEAASKTLGIALGSGAFPTS